MIRDGCVCGHYSDELYPSSTHKIYLVPFHTTHLLHNKERHYVIYTNTVHMVAKTVTDMLKNCNKVLEVVKVKGKVLPRTGHEGPEGE
jgi:hypothetical protein